MSVVKRILGITVLLLVVTSVAAPARAATGTTRAQDSSQAHLEVKPNTVQAGHQVSLQASCGGHATSATASSRAFANDVQLQQQQGSGGSVMTATATVPTDTRPGDYRINLNCSGAGNASAQLHVLDMARPTAGPPTGGGGTAGPGTAAPLLAGGLAAAAVGVGLLLLRRRPA